MDRALSLQNVTHVVVQAGGRGTRLGTHTQNKPKCLLSVDGRPLIYSLFDRFPKAGFIVIVDYLADVFEKYVAAFPPAVSVTTIRTSGDGTLAGLSDALNHLPTDDEPFIVCWSDILLGELPDLLLDKTLTVGLTSAFPCRWSWSASEGLKESAADRNGVMGVFASASRNALSACPETGDFVRWLSQSGLPITPIEFPDAKEVGTIADLEAQKKDATPTRFFNEVRIDEGSVEKTVRDPKYRELLSHEILWYRAVEKLGFAHVPKLFKEQPLTLERVRGIHPFELDVSCDGQKITLNSIVEALSVLHGSDMRAGSRECLDLMYYKKPLERLYSVQRLVPHLTTRETLEINGLHCRNILHPAHSEWFQACVSRIELQTFKPVHGDPTFSNTLIAKGGKPIFIDPRGRFGRSPLFGDPRYDWAKLYYSVVGGYDQFNARNFELRIDNAAIGIRIKDHRWGHLRSNLEQRLEADLEAIKIIHATIWMSLSGFVEDDYDSIIGAYAMGLYYLESAVARF